MIKSFLPLCLCLLFCAACSTTKHTSSHSESQATTAVASIPKSTDDGLSFATAVVITEKTETSGVQAEYAWIKQHYENYEIKKQSLSYHDKKPFNVITITLANGNNLDLYFDITNYFGKF